jgi:hypothetical protein
MYWSNIKPINIGQLFFATRAFPYVGFNPTNHEITISTIISHKQVLVYTDYFIKLYMSTPQLYASVYVRTASRVA